jgi:hypothetical protein
LEADIMNKRTSALLLLLAATFAACNPYYDEDDDYSGYQGTYQPHDSTPPTPCVGTPPPNEEVMQKGICDEARAALLLLSNDELHAKATRHGLGNCEIHDGSNATACSQYVKVTTATWWNRGWPLNPASRDSTGCVSTHCYPGYSPDMCGCDLTQNSVAQIRDALRDSHDVCGICDPERAITAEMVLEDN